MSLKSLLIQCCFTYELVSALLYIISLISESRARISNSYYLVYVVHKIHFIYIVYSSLPGGKYCLSKLLIFLNMNFFIDSAISGQYLNMNFFFDSAISGQYLNMNFFIDSAISGQYLNMNFFIDSAISGQYLNMNFFIDSAISGQYVNDNNLTRSRKIYIAVEQIYFRAKLRSTLFTCNYCLIITIP